MKNYLLPRGVGEKKLAGDGLIGVLSISLGQRTGGWSSNRGRKKRGSGGGGRLALEDPEIIEDRQDEWKGEGRDYLRGRKLSTVPSYAGSLDFSRGGTANLSRAILTWKTRSYGKRDEIVKSRDRGGRRVKESWLDPPWGGDIYRINKQEC